MNLDQRGEAGGAGQRVEVAELVIGENRDDQENRVRAPLDGLENLAFVDDEILAQQRQFHRRANLPEIIQRALEKLFIRQHRETTRTRALVVARNSHRIEIRANDSRGRRRLLDLGDQRDSWGAAQRGEKITRLIALQQRVAQIARGQQSRGQRGDFAVFLGDDGVEDAHGKL